MVSSLGTRMHASLVLMYIGRATFKITDYFVLVHVLRCCLPVETTSHGLICIMIVDFTQYSANGNSMSRRFKMVNFDIDMYLLVF